MFTKFSIWFLQNNIGDYCSFLGVFISIIGFIITIKNLIKTHNASKEAKLLVEKVRDDLKWSDSVTSLATAIATMEEIKRLQRMNAWEILPDRYSNLRKSLINIRTSNVNLTEEELKLFQGAISQFSTLERTIEEYLSAKAQDLEYSKINNVVSKQIDKIQEVLVIQKQKIGRNL